MKLTFLGAAHEVTGSCFLLEACGKNIVVECGMEQGKDIYENQELPVSAADVDCVFLTHAHIDHSGNLPLLYAQGFRGEIYATNATVKLCEIMLRDSAHIQQSEAEWKNRKAQRAGGEPIVPLYTMDDAEGAIKLFAPCCYNNRIKIYDGIELTFVDAGHLLGSASLQVDITENGETRKLVFSGDIGNDNQPILKSPSYLDEADYIVMESTYGDRSHGEVHNYIEKLTEIIQRTFDRGGNVVIPSFAVGRTQELLYFLRIIKEKELVKNHSNFPVYIDSPLAIEATSVFTGSAIECYDDETMELVRAGINPISFPGLRIAVSPDESKNINFDTTPKIIISASGMCEAGRIRHHLKHNLWRPECTILFVGYQAVGTLGRSLYEGLKSVKLFGETVDVKADITVLAGVSGHADNEGLMKWASSFKNKPTRVFVVHGEDKTCDIFADRLRNELHYNTSVPYSGESWDIINDVCVAEGNKVKIVKPAATGIKVSTVYEKLLNAGRRLMSVISHNEGGTNKDLSKLAEQINAICDKWDR